MLGIVKQPILVFGLGASGALWLFDSFGNRFTDFGDWGVWGLIIVGIALWRLGGRQPGTGVDVLPSQFNQAEVEQALNRVRNNLKVLLAESDSDEDLCGFQERLEALEQTDEQRSLTLGVTGRKGVGKNGPSSGFADRTSSRLNPGASDSRLTLLSPGGTIQLYWLRLNRRMFCYWSLMEISESQS